MSGKMGKVLKGCLLVAAGLCLLVALLFAAMVGWSIYASDRAEKGATAFCAATRPGEDIARVLERARGVSAPMRHFNDGDTYYFVWQGTIFESRDCVVETSAGRVVSKRYVENRD